ncbi:hypothetical protein L1049_011136 [Liquidambar formosana]|uniref:NB-ARC domain-containing protein n=1 Tax=Liquidambar formosana TaxID=63359 RepID=A0AAP0WZJ2_LIQFO
MSPKLLLKDEPKISVIPIVGMVGNGKTAVAQIVYHDRRVERHFDIKAWPCVPKEFNVVRITKSILNSVGFAASDSDDLIGLQDKVKEALTSKKLLIVLDECVE